MDGTFRGVERVQCSGFTEKPRYRASRCKLMGVPNGRGTLWGRFYCHHHIKWLRRKDEPVTWIKLEARELGWWLNLERNRNRRWPVDLF